MDFVKETMQKWQAGISHMFIIYGNIGDIINEGSRIQGVLLKSPLCSSKQTTILYDRSSGITFPTPTSRQVFYNAIGMDPTSMDDDMLPREPAPTLRLIERVLTRVETKRRIDPETHDEGEEYIMPLACVIISFAETICPANDVSAMCSEDRTVLVTLERWARDPKFVSIGPPIFLITENLSDIHPALRNASSRVEAIEVKLPDNQIRLNYLKTLSSLHEVQVDNFIQAAGLTAGLKKVHIEDIMVRASLENQLVTAELIKARKDEIMRSEFAEVLETVNPEHGFESIGGMEHVKEFFQRNIIKPIKEGNLRRVPLGVLLLGPPGTGKTLLAETVAKESGLNCAKLNLSKIFNQWVGSSERNLDRAFSCLEALAPCLVIVDEIDQSGLSRENSGDSGVSNRLFKRLLEFTSDPRHRGHIVFIGLSNRPDLIDPALKRPGRFDKKILIAPPNEKDRENIFRVIFEKENIDYTVLLNEAAANTAGYTGAEIEVLCRKALEIAEDEGSQTIDNSHLMKAQDSYVPTTKDIQQQIKLAIAECNDKDLIPSEYRYLLEERRKPDENRTETATRIIRTL